MIRRKMFLNREGGLRRVVQFTLVLLMMVSQAPLTHGSARRPPMPAAFDAETVNRLLDTVEQDSNASILKVGYFARRIQHPLPLEEGWTLVQAAVQKAPKGSKRWFLLQNLRALAAFRIPSVSPTEGFEAYETLFEQASQAPKVGAEYTVKQSINEFVGSVPGRLKGLGLGESEQAQNTLVKAWVASETLLNQDSNVKGTPLRAPATPPWVEAIEQTGAMEKFLPLLDKSLKSPNAAPRYDLFRIGADLYKTADPRRSIELLQQAKPLLPKSDVVEVAQFYDTLVQRLEESNRLSDAVTTQQERVRIVGSGRARLLVLQVRVGDTSSVTQLLAFLSSPNANEYEINLSAELMDQLFAQDKKRYSFLDGKATLLRESYLTTNRARSVEQELRARLALARSYMAAQNTVKASEVLTPDFTIEAVPSGDARDLWDEMQKYRTHLDQTNKEQVGKTPLG